jgi:DivIVA domain-containing protein
MSGGYGDLVEAITTATFRPVRVREGYDMAAVDDLLDRVVAALGRGEPVGRVLDEARLAHVRLREGYDVAEVDAFLAHVRRSAPSPEDPSSESPPSESPSVPVQRASTGPERATD